MLGFDYLLVMQLAIIKLIQSPTIFKFGLLLIIIF
jgi:hypothetical protein